MGALENLPLVDVVIMLIPFNSKTNDVQTSKLWSKIEWVNSKRGGLITTAETKI